ncbi:uncharacterized protein LOC129217766 [Uloborus diversus]|uniref:uncharacterized protein LOC129217766 n=1 Tax=Uloborus diversus TaxID=327109 RepID=UPI002409E8B4|nr:uncharacterized protein LOC129217766 [Uloborus diversus]
MNAPYYYFTYNKEQSTIEGAMELDAALHELGMLSTITDSRLDYLRNKVKKRNRSSKSLCVVQMNSDFVTEFSLSKSSAVPNGESESEEENNGTSTPEDIRIQCPVLEMLPPTWKLDFNTRRKIKRAMTRHYKFKPYDFPWRSKLEDSLRNIPAATAASEGASPPTVSRQDSGNKSNPSSPVKSQKSLTNLGCSIFRSRSLDDLDISKLDLKDDCCLEASRVEIDTVSQRIGKLHVS